MCTQIRLLKIAVGILPSFILTYLHLVQLGLLDQQPNLIVAGSLQQGRPYSSATNLVLGQSCSADKNH